MELPKSRIIPKLLFLLFLAGIFLGFKYLKQQMCIERSKIVERNVPKLVDELDSSFTCIRSRAALDLWNVGSAGAPAIPKLLSLLNDPTASVRWRSVAAIGHIGVWSAEVRDAVFAMFDDQSRTVRINTLFAISRMRYLTNEDGVSRTLDPDFKMPERGADIFLAALSDKNAAVVKKSLFYFSNDELRIADSEFQSAFRNEVIRLYKGSNRELSGHALTTLASIESAKEIERIIPDYQSQLTTLLESKDSSLRAKAAWHLAKLRDKDYPRLIAMRDGSIEKYRKLCELKKKGAHASEPCYSLAELFDFKGDLDTAYHYYELACNNEFGREFAGCEKLGDRARDAGEISLAKKYYQLATLLSVSKSDSFIKLAQILSDEGNQKEACFWLSNSCRNGNDKACELGAQCEGLAEAKAARESGPILDLGEYAKQLDLAWEQKNKGNFENAVTILTKLLDKGYGNAASTLSDVYVEAGRENDALKLLGKACEQFDPLTCVWLGRLHARRGEDDKALGAFERSCLADRKECAEELAWFYATRGRTSDARDEYSFLCQVSSHLSQRNEYCKKSVENPLPDRVLDLEQACLKGNYKACREVRDIYHSHLDFEKALRLGEQQCNNENSFVSCRNYLSELQRTGRIAQYDSLLDTFCPGNEEACGLLVRRKMSLGDVESALSLSKAICLESGSSMRCRKFKALARSSIEKESYRKLLLDLCEKQKEASSCLELAVASDIGESKRRDYLTLVRREANEQCQRGREGACAEEALILCALDEQKQGEAVLFRLCRKNQRYCAAKYSCSRALKYMRGGYN